MRRINSEFKTGNMSEEGQKLSNRDYFGYVEMDDYAFYVLADSLDNEPSVNSAKIVVESLIRDFTERPSMRKRILKTYMGQAHKALTQYRRGMRLKASVVAVITDYKKIRYCYTGNSRFYLIRSGRIRERSIDQSLTQNMIKDEKIPLDQAAAHEARNNLYSYLGKRGTLNIQISKKTRLEDGDIFTLLTRGTWERCSDLELLDYLKDAKEPEEALGQAEDRILQDQDDGTIDNYSLAITFVNKVYQSPKRTWTAKRILMIAIPVLLAVGGMGIMLYLRHQSRKAKEANLEKYMISGETYLRYDNYQKASEEYGEAVKLANSLKRQDSAEEADKYKKLAEQIIMADEAMEAGDYQKAQNLYLTAKGMSAGAGNVGRSYINSQMERTKDYIEIFDLMELGERKENYGDYNGAVEIYKEAREKAADLYYAEGKSEALQRQAAAEEKLGKEQQKEESRKKEAAEAAEAAEDAKQKEAAMQQQLDNQQKVNDQQSAIEMENKGNELLADGKYESAITFYQTAQAIYIRLELPDLADGINGKIEAAMAGQEAEKKLKEEERTGKTQWEAEEAEETEPWEEEQEETEETKQKKGEQ